MKCRNNTEKKQRMVKRNKGKLIIYGENGVCKIAYFALKGFTTLIEDKLNKNQWSSKHEFVKNI